MFLLTNNFKSFFMARNNSKVLLPVQQNWLWSTQTTVHLLVWYFQQNTVCSANMEYKVKCKVTGWNSVWPSSIFFFLISISHLWFFGQVPAFFFLSKFFDEKLWDWPTFIPRHPLCLRKFLTSCLHPPRQRLKVQVKPRTLKAQFI